MALSQGCQWDPPRDNPLDSASDAYHNPFGFLRFRVQTLVQQPIFNATVMIPELGRFALADSHGIANFDEIPIGTWWVVAFRDTPGNAIYARDSVQVTIDILQTTEKGLLLDALPSVNSAYALSGALMEDSSFAYFYIRLKATISDPDGIADLAQAEVTFSDTIQSYDVRVELQYRADSAFWWADIPSNSFHNGKTDNALFLPFTFRAFDFAENVSPVRTTFVPRILHSPAEITGIQIAGAQITVDWNFTYWNELLDASTYNYIVIIYRAPELIEIYRRTVTPDGSAIGRHIVESPLQPGYYTCEVWVVDKFGNSIRSERWSFQYEPPQ